MNFLSLRSQLQQWTLNSDDKLYRAIQQLSKTVLEAEKVIINNIQTTRYQVIKGNVQSGFSYNHYLRISQTKFTQNKIGQKVSHEKKQDNVQKTQARNKMDIFKQAIEIGVKNLQITEQKGNDNDLVSMSDTSLSQSIYKDCRTPAIYGTKQFAVNSFLNLFTDNQLNALVPTEEFQTNELMVNQMQQNQSLPPPPSFDGNLLPPPPSLDSILNSNYSNGPTSLPSNLPPPPTLNLLNLPPPPPLPGLLNPPSLSNLPVPPPLNFDLPSNIPPPPPLNNVEVQQKIQVPIAPVTKPKQGLSVQQQLALRLKYGKDYKKQVEIKIQQPKQEIKIQVSVPGQIKLPQISEERQSLQSSNIRASIRSSFKGIDFNPLANSISNKVVATHDDPQEEQVDALFGPSKNKNKQSKKPVISVNVTAQNDIMKRQTFNEDILFKKKPQPQKKQIQKPKNTLFGDDNQEQQIDFTFKKKQKKQQIKIKPNPISNPVEKQTKKKGGLLDSQSDDEDSSALFKKKEKKGPIPVSVPTKVQQPITTEKKQLNPLFKPSQPKQVEVKVTVTTPKKQNNILVEQTQNKKLNKNLLGVQQNEQNIKVDRSSSNLSSASNHASSYAMKVAAAGGMGMMGMGMGMPIMPRGMILTKPSQTKKNQQQAKLRQKQIEEQQRKAREQEQRLLQIQRAQQQKIAQQRLEVERKRLEQQNRIKQQQLIKIRIQQQQEQQKIQEQLMKKQPQIKLPQKPKPMPIKPTTQKRNALFDDDQQQDIFKPKTKKTNPILPPTPKITQPQIKKENIIIKQNIPIVPPKQQQKIVIQQNIVTKTQSISSSKNQLAVRRKKAKPSLKSNILFDDQQDEVIKIAPLPKKPIIQNSNAELERIKKQQQQQRKRIDLQKQIQRQNKEKQAQLLRKQQQQRQRQLLKQKQLEQQIRKQKQRLQQIRRIQQAQKLKKIQQQQQREYQRQIKLQQQTAKAEREKLQQIRRQQQQQAQLIKKQEQQRQRQLLRQKQLDQAARIQRERIQQLRIDQQRERLRKQQQRLEQLKKQQQQREKKQREIDLAIAYQELRGKQDQAKREQQQKRLQQQTKRQRQEMQRHQRMRRQQQAQLQKLKKQRQAQQARIRQLQIDQQRRRNQQLTKKQQQPISPPAPFLPKLPARSNQPLGGPLGPSISSLPKTGAKQPLGGPLNAQSKKGSLFDEEQQSELKFGKTTKPSINKPSVSITNNSKKGLFGDDDDLDNSNFLSSKPVAQKPKVQASKSPLFNDEDEQPKMIVNKPKPIQSQPIKQPVATKPAAKKTLFDDDDDDLSGNTFLKKPTQNKTQSVSPSIPQSSPQKPIHKSQSVPVNNPPPLQGIQKQAPVQQKKKNLFDDDDDDGFLNKKPTPVAQKSPAPTNILAQKPPAATQAKKKNLFDDSGSDDDFMKKKPATRKPF